jgi:site-specific DNA-methyltransferase (adenine-specific)
MSKVELFLGDCFEVMRGIPDGMIDAVITDPPYGVALKTNYRERGRGRLWQANDYPPIVGDDKPFDPTPFLKYHTVILFGANYFADKLPASMGWIVWDKREGIVINDQADCELIWTNQHRAARIFSHLWNGMLKASERDQRRVHPTQKPVALMQWIIENYTSPGDTILDPFMGSGTTGVACARLNRNFIGIEISEQYFEIAKRRIAEAQAQVPMPFDWSVPQAR